MLSPLHGKPTFVALAVALAAAAMSPALCSVEPSASPIIPTAADRSLYEAGRSKERIALSLAQPRNFSIALLRDRSLADLAATELLLSKARVPQRTALAVVELKTLQTYIETGDFKNVNPRIWNPNVIEFHLLIDPPDDWLINAGMASVDADAARADIFADVELRPHPQYLSFSPIFAGQYASLVHAKPPTAESWPPAWPTSLADQQAYESEVSERLAAVFPEPAYPAISYGTGPVADARRGVALATATEMLLVPGMLAQHESQAFIDDLIASLKSTTNNRTARFLMDDARIDLAVPPIVHHFEVAPRVGMISGDMTFYSMMIDHASSQSFLLGQFAADVFFGVSSGADHEYIAGRKSWFATIDDLDSVIPGFKDARLALAGVSEADPLDVRAKSLRVIQLIMGSN